ncbi:hypothetical protein NW761_011143 [Fusarium oxysporum]|nr:hypothetical protein NW758_012256 [Fusarium oxysporum]KAJ4060757.1 hypothetical protein NW753_005024 [Fusarium oxysporum]KAJ4063950.1 hypothetical protein NW763_004226 [Fusarium oxysporum]KAJ4077028.1 hypothetical protein NW756_012516 [Fusarium oxysporum]KAJ4079736.1 hypothetical protein NW761_011143 [Fusarium oxysporum]
MAVISEGRALQTSTSMNSSNSIMASPISEHVHVKDRNTPARKWKGLGLETKAACLVRQPSMNRVPGRGYQLGSGLPDFLALTRQVPVSPSASRHFIRRIPS